MGWGHRPDQKAQADGIEEVYFWSNHNVTTFFSDASLVLRKYSDFANSLASAWDCCSLLLHTMELPICLRLKPNWEIGLLSPVIKGGSKLRHHFRSVSNWGATTYRSCQKIEDFPMMRWLGNISKSLPAVFMSRGEASRDFKFRSTHYQHSCSLNITASCQLVLFLVHSYCIKTRDQNFQTYLAALVRLDGPHLSYNSHELTTPIKVSYQSGQCRVHRKVGQFFKTWIRSIQNYSQSNLLRSFRSHYKGSTVSDSDIYCSGSRNATRSYRQKLSIQSFP